MQGVALTSEEVRKLLSCGCPEHAVTHRIADISNAASVFFIIAPLYCFC